jgi:hypothetical protein
VVLVIFEALWLKTKNPLYHQLARFWTRKCGSAMKLIAFIERHQTEVTCLPAGRLRRFCGTADCGRKARPAVRQRLLPQCRRLLT